MSEIVYGEQDIDWYRSPIDPDLLESLNKRSNFKGLIQGGGHLLICAATGSLCFYIWSQVFTWYWLLLFIPALYLHGTVCHFMVNGVHELVHGTVFRSKWLNQLFVHVMAFIGWTNHYAFWASHSEHHKYTLNQPDDQEVILPTTFKFKDIVLSIFINVLAIKPIFFGTMKTATGDFGGEWGRHVMEDKPSHGHTKNWARFILFGHAVIIGLSIWQELWILPLLLCFTPMYGGLLFFLLNNTQHVGLRDSVNDFRLNSRTILLNPIPRFLYWQMNYHIEHHMYAAVPCYNLHKLHKAIKDDLPPCPNGIVATWFQIIGILHRQKEDPNYAYTQQIPQVVKEQEADQSKIEPMLQKDSAPKKKISIKKVMAKIWQCTVCGFIYNEALGLPEEGLAPGTAWEDIPDDWCCPDCGISKSDFEMKEIKETEIVASENNDTESKKNDTEGNTVAENSVEENPTTESEGKDMSENSSDAIVIVGSGLAAYSVAREFRALNKEK